MGANMTTGMCQADEAPLLDNDELESYASGSENREENEQALAPKKPAKTPLYVYLLSFLSAIGGFLFGYDTGVVAGAILPIQEKFHFNDVWKELFVSITVAAAAIFAIVGGQLNDRIGRKPTTLIASFVFAFGAILLAAAQNTAMLMIGRFILGIGIGFASMTVPVYIAESAPPTVRGQLVSLNQAFIAGGQLVSLIVSAGFCPVMGGWRYMLGLAAIPPIVQFVGFLFMPESPRWLVDNHKDALAIQVLRKIRGTTDVKAEYTAIKNACEEEAKARQLLGGQSVIRKVINNAPVRRALIIGCLTQVFQQITGINTVMYYSATIVRMAGVSDTCQAIWLASITAFSNFIFTFVGIALVERLGRRILFLSSLAGVTISLLFLGIAFQIEHSNAPDITINPSSADLCAQKYSSCNSCIESEDCGFCFIKSEDGVISNLTCLTAADTRTTSISGLCSSASTANSTSTWAYDYCPTPYSWMAVLGMVLYLACFSPGLGPMPWTINSEIYPLWARSFGNSLATFFNWTFNLLISMTFLSLSTAITKQGAFYLYASFGVVGFVFFFLFLPETRGISLENMDVLFSGSWFVRSKRKTQLATQSIELTE